MLCCVSALDVRCEVYLVFCWREIWRETMIRTGSETYGEKKARRAARYTLRYEGCLWSRPWCRLAAIALLLLWAAACGLVCASAYYAGSPQLVRVAGRRCDARKYALVIDARCDVLTGMGMWLAGGSRGSRNGGSVMFWVTTTRYYA